MKEVYLYEFNDKCPFEDWIHKLPKKEQATIWTRINRVRLGNLGDSKPIKCKAKGLHELRFKQGPGYRIYFTIEKDKVVILLCGGDKGSQKQDIKKAIEYLIAYQESHKS